MDEYMEVYAAFKNLFDAYFGENAAGYWEIFKKYEYEENMSYEKLAILYHYSATKIRNIVHQVKQFLDEPLNKLAQKDYSISALHDKECRMPNLFIRGYYSLPLTEGKLFNEAVCLYQNLFPLWIPRSHIMACGRQYANLDRREKLCKNLRKFKIYTEEGVIKIFDKFDRDKDGIVFAFTEQALDYIDIYRYMTRLMEKEMCENI